MTIDNAPDFIAFNLALIPKVLSKKKRATTRIGIRTFAVGSLVKLTDPEGTPFGAAIIESVNHTTLDGLTEQLAVDEGTTLVELKKNLIKIYGEPIKTSPVSVIYFSYVEN